MQVLTVFLRTLIAGAATMKQVCLSVYECHKSNYIKLIGLHIVWNNFLGCRNQTKKKAETGDERWQHGDGNIRIAKETEQQAVVSMLAPCLVNPSNQLALKGAK